MKALKNWSVFLLALIFISGCTISREVMPKGNISEETVKNIFLEDLEVGDRITVLVGGNKYEYLKLLEIHENAIRVKKWGHLGNKHCTYLIMYKDIYLIEVEKVKIEDPAGFTGTGLLLLLFLLV